MWEYSCVEGALHVGATSCVDEDIHVWELRHVCGTSHQSKILQRPAIFLFTY